MTKFWANLETFRTLPRFEAAFRVFIADGILFLIIRCARTRMFPLAVMESFLLPPDTMSVESLAVTVMQQPFHRLLCLLVIGGELFL